MHTVHSFSKPYVAIIDGITMGGGCGLALNGEKFVIATERTMVAMPETYIGYFPDSGAAHFFKGNLGMFLGLTGFRLKGADVFHTGLATHFVSSNDLPILERHLLSLSTNEASKEKIQEILSNFHLKNLPQHTLQPHLEEIEKHFSKNSVEDIMDSLNNSNSEFSKKIFSDLQKLAPTALKVTFQHIRNAPQSTFHELLTIENRLTQRFLRNHDFREGTRALLIDKDKNPKWKPSTLEEVSQEMVDSYFQPLEIPENEWFLENHQ
uniref:3-hydroxyisobutyryl-CoA hydrolase, mitochondrial n=1 Tax=Acrobeloides nanus TaxID=290746 RepID=A0A914CQL6_9BILA